MEKDIKEEMRNIRFNQKVREMILQDLFKIKANKNYKRIIIRKEHIG